MAELPALTAYLVLVVVLETSTAEKDHACHARPGASMATGAQAQCSQQANDTDDHALAKPRRISMLAIAFVWGVSHRLDNSRYYRM